MASMPSRSAGFAAATKASRTRVRPCVSSARGAASPSLCGTAEGASVCQPPCANGICCPPSHGVWLDPLRPACASCIATAVFECLRTDARIGFSAASVASFHRPRQPGVMRPIASTWVASMQNIAAPDSASVLMCVKCQSLASPLTAEYWHIGATMMRLGSVRPRRAIGENRALMGDVRMGGERIGDFYLASPCPFLNHLTLLLDPRGLDQFNIGRGFPHQEIIHFLWRHRHGLDAELLQAVLHGGIGQHLDAGGMEFIDDVARRLRRH